MAGPAEPFLPPPYPYDRLDRFRPVAGAHEGGLVDLSVGTPTDPAPSAVVAALACSGAEHGYPASIGTPRFREAAAGWMSRRLGADVPAGQVRASIGTKELVASLPRYLRLRDPSRDTVLYPSVAYPSYEMGAVLAGCRAVAVPVDSAWRLDLGAIGDEDAGRALCLWVNSPANPTGAVDDLAAAAAWGRRRAIPVLSDECYIEFTWSGSRSTVLAGGLEGVVAVHSLSKRSNLAGLRAGFYAGDAELVTYLGEVRKHAGMMVPGPVQAAAAAALDDDGHVEEQAGRYRQRLDFLAGVLREAGIEADMPGGAFYLWVAAPGGDAWGLTARLAEVAGTLVSPGEFYGPPGAGHVRIAAVQPMERLELVARRLEGVTL